MRRRRVLSALRTYDLAIDGMGPGQLIGEGASARVYRAERQTHGDDVAVKLLDRRVDEADRALFEKELRALEVLKSVSHIVGALGYGLNGRNEPYLVMPLFEAGSIEDAMKEELFEWEAALDVVANASRAVQGAHDLGILHRDLKPANLLVSRNGSVYVSDFGIAKVIETAARSTLGGGFTLGFAPPEAFDGSQEFGSDVYALGATFAAMVTGTVPFLSGDPEQDTFKRIVFRVLHDPPPDLTEAGCPPEINDVITSAMSKEVDDRPSSAGEFAAQLHRARQAALGLPEASASGIAATVASGWTPENDDESASTEPAAEPSPFRKVPIALAVLLIFGVAAFLLTRGGTDSSGDGNGDIAAIQDQVTATAVVTPTSPPPTATPAVFDAIRAELPVAFVCEVGERSGQRCVEPATTVEREQTCDEAGLIDGDAGCLSATDAVSVCPNGTTPSQSRPGQCESSAPANPQACPASFQLTGDGQNCLRPSETVTNNGFTSVACTQGVLSTDNQFCIVPRLSTAPTLTFVPRILRCAAGTLDGGRCLQPADPGTVPELVCATGLLMDDDQECFLGPATRVEADVLFVCPQGSIPNTTQPSECTEDDRVGAGSIQYESLIVLNGADVIEQLTSDETADYEAGCWFGTTVSAQLASLYCIRSGSPQPSVDRVPLTVEVIDEGLVQMEALVDMIDTNVSLAPGAVLWGVDGPVLSTRLTEV